MKKIKMKDISLLERMYIFLYLKYKRIFKKITERYIIILIRKNYNPDFSLINKSDLVKKEMHRNVIHNFRTEQDKKKRMMLSMIESSPIPRHFIYPNDSKKNVIDRDYILAYARRNEIRPNPKFFISLVTSTMYIEIDH